MSGSIKIKRGDTIRWPVTFEDDSGTPIDLTGYTIESVIRGAWNREIVDEFVVTLGDQGTDPGTLELLIEDTSAIDPGKYAVDLRYVEPDSDVFSSETWELVVEPEVTER